MLCLPVDILAHHVTQGNTVGGQTRRCIWVHATHRPASSLPGQLAAASAECMLGPVDVLSTAVPAAAVRCPCLQALQEPLGVALGVLDEVEAFRQALVAQDVARVSGQERTATQPCGIARQQGMRDCMRNSHLCAACTQGKRPYWRRTQHPWHAPIQAQDSASPDGSAANAAQLCKRLKELVARLDSVLPYLNLAISTVALLNQGGWVLLPRSCACCCLDWVLLYLHQAISAVALLNQGGDFSPVLLLP